MTEVDLKPAADQSGDFSSEQKRYLEGFVAGVQIAKAAKSVAGVPATSGAAAPAVEPAGPDAAAFKAQNRVLAAGKKLSDQEKFKREQHPFDSYERLKEFGVRHVALLEEKLGRKFDRAVPGAVAPRPAFDRTAHIGIH